MHLKEQAKAIKTNIPALVIAVKHKNTPVGAKFLAALAVGYALSPIDLIPDSIPVLGYLDDLLIVSLLIALAVTCIPSEVLEQCKREAEQLHQEGQPKKWYYALPIITVWLLIVWWVVSSCTQ